MEANTGVKERDEGEAHGEKHPPPSETDTSTPLGVECLRRQNAVIM